MKLPASKKKPWLFDALLLAFLFGLAIFVFYQYRPFERGISGDASMQIYVAQQVIRGHPPYLTVFFPKTPLTGFWGAMALFVGRALGIPDVLAIRTGFLITTLLGVILMYSLAKGIAGNRMAGVMAALAFIFCPIIGKLSFEPQPKMLAMFWGLFSLWAMAKSSWFMSGLGGSLSFLSWQPGGVYVFLVLVAAYLREVDERAKGLKRALSGILVPLALLGIYLIVVDAWAPALRQTLFDQIAWLFNPGKSSLGLGSRLTRSMHETLRSFEEMSLLGWLALLGWVGFSVESVIAMVQRREGSSLSKTKIPLLLSGYFWFGFSFLELDSRADLVVWLMHLTFGFGWLMGLITHLSRRAIAGLRWATPQRYLHYPLILIIPLLVILYAREGMPANTSGPGLKNQEGWARELDRELGPEDRIQCFGHLLPLILTNRVNLTPMMNLGPKAYNLVTREPGGFQAILDTIRRERPKIIIVQRNYGRPWAKPLQEFLKENYQKLGLYTFKLRGK